MRSKILLISGKYFSNSANKCGSRKQNSVEIRGVLLGLKAAWEEKAFMQYFGCSIPELMRNRVVFRAFAVMINFYKEEGIPPKPLWGK